MNNKIITLADLKSGEKGIVESLRGGRAFKSRMVSMGVNIGCEIEIIQSFEKNMGPALVSLNDSRLALGHGMIEKIVVKKMS